MGRRTLRDDPDPRWQEAAEQAGTTECARGPRCAAADYQGRPALGPRPFCDRDEGNIRMALACLPENYVRLRLLLARTRQDAERVSGSRDAPIPLATDIDAFMREIVAVTCGWETAVRTAARMSAYPPGRRRDGVRLGDACAVLCARLPVLLALGDIPVSRLASPGRADEVAAERGDDRGALTQDGGGQWHEHGVLDGTGAGLEFLALHGRARGMLGLTRQRRAVTEVPCDECRAVTLVQWESWSGGWDPEIRCTLCPNVYAGARFELLMGRIYRVQAGRLAEHGQVA